MNALRAQIPNALSLSRIPLGIAFLLIYTSGDPTQYKIAMIIAAAAIATDLLDGFLARRWKVTTEAGYFLDGIGDKAFYIAVMLVMMRERTSNSLLIWLLIARDIFLYALRSIDDRRTANMASLRPLSKYYALFIRLYFLNFVIIGGYLVSGYKLPSYLAYGDAFGYAAAALGYLSIAFLIKRISEQDE